MKKIHRSQLAWAAFALALAAGTLVAQDGDASARKPMLLAEALKARDEGNLQAAKEKFEAILAIDPKDMGANEGLLSVNAAIAEASASKQAADAKPAAPAATAPAAPAPAVAPAPASALDEVANNHQNRFNEVTRAIQVAKEKIAGGDLKRAIEILDGANGAIADIPTAAAQKLRAEISVVKQDAILRRDNGPSYAVTVAEGVKSTAAHQKDMSVIINNAVVRAESLIRKGSSVSNKDNKDPKKGYEDAKKDLQEAWDLLSSAEEQLKKNATSKESIQAQDRIKELKLSVSSRAALLAISYGDFISAQRKIDDYKLIQDGKLDAGFREAEEEIQARFRKIKEDNSSKWTKLEEDLHEQNLKQELAALQLRKDQAARLLKDDTVSAKLQRELDEKKKYSVVRNIDELSPGVSAKDEKVNELLVKGRARYLYGDYQGALDAYREVLQYQPNNSESKAYQIRIRQMLSENSGQWNRGVTKGKLMELLDETWKLPEVFNRENTKNDVTDNDPVTEKMKTIRLPEGFVARDEPLDRALTKLSSLSQTYDKDQKGVNIVPVTDGGESPTVNLQLRDVTVFQALDYLCKRVGYSFSVSPSGIVEVRKDAGDSLLDTQFFELTQAAVVKMTGQGLNTTAPGGAASNPFGGASGAAGPADGNPQEMAIKSFLIRSGVPFEPPATLSFDGTRLIVTGSPKNLDRVKNIIRRYSDIKQVHIEAKFIEVEQKALNELGVNWSLTPNVAGNGGVTAGTNLRSINRVFAQNNTQPKNLTINSQITDAGGNTTNNTQIFPNVSPTFPGGMNLGNLANTYSGTVNILSRETLALTIRAIEESAGSDLMSSPSLTVLDGKTAVIKVAQLLRYPQAYGDIQSNVGQGGGGGGGVLGAAQTSVAITAGTPQDFTVQEVGVTLEVTPTVAADDSIALNLKPKVTEFEGFVEYGGTSVALTGGVTVTVPSGFFQPIFSTREVTTDVTVFDGATVVIGGLTREEVKTIDDKVPVLGSLPLIGAAFRSSGKSVAKRSLMVFVTANLVSPGGATLRSTHPGMRAGATFSNPTLISPGGAVYREPIEAATPSAPAPVVGETAK